MMQSGQAPKYQNSRRTAARAVVLGLRRVSLGGVLAFGAMTSSLVPAQQTTAPVAPVSVPVAESPSVAAARDAMQRRQWQRLPGLVASAVSQNELLAMYAQYWLLRYQINTPGLPTPVKPIQEFLQRHAGAYLADRLRGDWILAAARSGDFATVRDLGEVQAGSAQIGCARLAARHKGGQRATAQEARDVFAPGAACWSLYDQLVTDRILDTQTLRQQIRDAVEIDDTAYARRLAAYVLTSEQINAYDAILRDPQGWLDRRDHAGVSPPAERELLPIALVRAVRKDRDGADAALRATWAALLSPADLQWVRSQFALVAALNLDPRADRWYRDAGLDLRLTEYNHAWRVRAALRQPRIDWQWVRAAIARMPTSQQTEPAWVYWAARALAADGQTEAARARYEKLAEAHHFYGQLAAEELGRALTVPAAPEPVTSEELAQVRAHPGLQRAVALFRLGWRQEAVPEWNFSLRGMTDRQLLAAAELARQEQIYDRVVNTSERTVGVADFSQRYIAPFETRITEQAREIALDPAWVYGVIRQESRFIMNARSHVGASGLMQLMPTTAQWTAKRIGMRDFHPSRVNDLDVNTKLGAHYLNIVLQDLGGSQVLASAGYNAGPGRPKLWRSRLSHTVEGAIFAETIPFTETRDYVKTVMSNTTWYAALFSGTPQSLKTRLGHIAPAPAPRGAQIP